MKIFSTRKLSSSHTISSYTMDFPNAELSFSVTDPDDGEVFEFRFTEVDDVEIEGLIYTIVSFAHEDAPGMVTLQSSDGELYALAPYDLCRFSVCF